MKRPYLKVKIRFVCGFSDAILASGEFYLNEKDDFTVNDIFEGWWLR